MQRRYNDRKSSRADDRHKSSDSGSTTNPNSMKIIQRIHTSAHYREILKYQSQTDHLSNSKSIYREFSSVTLGSQKTTEKSMIQKEDNC